MFLSRRLAQGCCQKLTVGIVHDELDVLTLLELTSSNGGDELRSNLACHLAAGVVDGELFLVGERLSGGENGQQGTGDVGELHIVG